MHIGILKRAIQEAELSMYHPYRVGAVLFHGARILSSGHNEIRSNPIHIKYKKYAEALHAEQACLIGLNWNKLRNCSILIVRLNISGNLSLAKPCSMCSQLISYVGLKYVYYSNRNGEIVKEKVI